MERMSNAIRARRPSESNLAALAVDQDLKVILVTAASPGSGTSSCTRTLAGELAQTSREPVLVVDACLSDSGLTRARKLEDRPGFLDLLATPQMAPQSCVVKLEQQPFDFLPLGGKGTLDPKALPQLFAALGQHYRFVILDGDAIYANSGLVSLAARVDGVVLVVRAEETRWEVAQAAVQRLNQADARVIGSIFNARRYYMPKWIYDNL